MTAAETRLPPREPDKPDEAFLAFERACRGNDPGACKTTLLRLARNRWPDQPPASLGTLASRVDSSFAEAIDRLNRALYGQDSVDWDGARLLHEAEYWLRSKPVSTASPASPIPPLHPHHE